MNSYESIYRATSYVVATVPEPLTLRIGQPNSALDALLAGQGAGTCAFITAWNPGSVPLDAAANHERNRALAAEIAALGYLIIPGAGRGDDGVWPPEESFLVIGISADEALRLGRSFGQRAVVFARIGEAPGFLWC